MASKQYFFAVLAIVAVILPTLAVATEFLVGDESGWTINFDYQAWAKDKEFRVGDKLVFKYTVGNHSVFKVNGTGFKDCIVPPENEGLATGNDVIPLATEGNKWYICGKADHCAAKKQKLSITVLSAMDAPAPAPSSANGIPISGYQILILAMTTIALKVMV